MTFILILEFSVCFHVYVHMRVWKAEVDAECFFQPLPSNAVKQGFFLNLELTSLAMLVVPRVLGIRLSLPPQCWDLRRVPLCPAFFKNTCAGDPNLPHAVWQVLYSESF